VKKNPSLPRDRTIEDVLNYETGEGVVSDEFFLRPLEETIFYRSELKKAILGIRKPLFI
jgi:hypothetical protein